VAKIKPEIYRKILMGLDLRKIYIRNFSGGIKSDVIGKVLSVNITSSRANFVTKDENLIEILQDWTVIAKEKKSQKECLNISVTYCLNMHSKENFTKEFLEVYQKTSLPLNVWPFVREFINNMTARMNLPPLTLPLFKMLPKR